MMDVSLANAEDGGVVPFTVSFVSQESGMGLTKLNVAPVPIIKPSQKQVSSGLRARYTTQKFVAG